MAQVGTTYNITGGTRPGSGPNLFQSFGLFNVGAGDIANFCNAAACGAPSVLAGIQNILGRVTGGQVSNIFGKIQTTGFDSANLYLINPAGWIFGSTSRLDVGGSFHASTADYIRFPDVDGVQVRFTADTSPLPASGLTANPMAFGFLNSTPTRIAVEGASLQVPTGKTLSLVAGEAAFPGQTETGLKIAGPVPTGQPSTLGAPGGQVQIVSVASPGEVSLNPNVSAFSKLGGIDLLNGASVNVSGDAGGTVVIRGGRLQMVGSSITANTTGNTNGAPLGVDIQVTGDLMLSSGTNIGVLSQQAGNAGDVQIQAGNLEMGGASVISELTAGTATGDGSKGVGGDVLVNTGSLTLKDGSRITTTAARSGVGATGPGGNISVIAADSALISGQNSGLLSTSQSSAPSGVGGDVTIAAGSLTIDAGATITTRSFQAAAGGDISLKVNGLSMTGGAAINSRTLTGPGGNIAVHAVGPALMSGTTTGIISGGSLGGSNSALVGDISLDVGQLTVTNNAQIQNGSIIGRTGNLKVTATDSIIVSNKGGISSQAFSQNVGQATISAPSLLIDSGFISTSTIGDGNAGPISMNVGTLTLANGGQVASNSALSASGTGGNVTVTATGPVSISGSSPSGVPVTPFITDASSGIFSTASGTGNAGQIILSTPTLTMADGGKISVATSGAGSAGSVSLNADTLSLTGGAQVVSSTDGAGQGGSVMVNAANSISISGSGSSPSGLFSTASSTGNAGQITVSAPTLTMGDGGAISVANSGAGNAGNIALNVSNFTQTGGARVDSSTSGSGLGGDLTVNAVNSASISDPGTGLFSTASGTGAGGDIKVQAPHVQILDGGTISANSTGTETATAGNVNIVTNDLNMQNSSITTEAAVALGGNISITTAASLVHLTDSEITTSVHSGVGSGGNITISSDLVVLDDSRILANAIGGHGGNITIAADVFLVNSGGMTPLSLEGIVDASSELEYSGNDQYRSDVYQCYGKRDPVAGNSA